MRTSTRIGIVGSSVAVAGSAALAALAPNAAAAGNYNSTATASSGTVNIGGQNTAPASVTATPTNSPQAASVPSSGLSSLTSGLQGLGGLGGTVSTSGSNLVSAEATASSDGQSTGCAAVLAANCDHGQGSPLSYKINLSGLGSLAGVGSSIGNLLQDSIVVSINGPLATCAAGPAGSSLSATDDTGTASASLQDSHGKTVGDPVTLKSGDVFSQLGSIPGLSTVLASLTSQAPLKVTLDPGSHSTGNGESTATAGELGLSSGSTTILDVKGAKVSCGPNNAAAGTTPPSGPGGTSPGSPGTVSTTSPTSPSSTSTSSGEKPLKGVQTDEGRSASSAPAWLVLTGAP